MGDAQQYRISMSAPNLVNVCIDDVSNGDMSGRMYCCYSKLPIRFSNIIELLRDMERLFNAISFPQASTKTRLFQEHTEAENAKKKKPEKVISQDEIIKHIGVKGTFIINVQFRQNATWQGEIFWIEKEIMQKFSNTLEMIRKIDGSIGDRY